MPSVCFLDFANWDYNVDRPLTHPLGGSQSALCYLSAALAKTDHGVMVMTGTSKPSIVRRVECAHLGNANAAFFRERAFDVVVVLNGSGYSKLRDILPSSTRLILWTQHEPVQPAMHKLAIPEVAERWDGIVCVSEWQRSAYVKAFKLAPERMTIIRNAIGPAFENLFSSPKDLANAKTNPLTLAYTSTPYRGLHLLLDIFPEFRKAHPEARLHVYSSMAVYPKHEEYDSGMFAWVYDALRKTDGVEYVGSLPQPALAERLATSHILAYSNVFPETSCIAVMEAMAAGMLVVTSDLAALPETGEGFASHVHLDFGDQRQYVRDYSRNLGTAGDYDAHDIEALYEQVSHMNQHHTWAIRAKQWSEYLRGLC